MERVANLRPIGPLNIEHSVRVIRAGIAADAGEAGPRQCAGHRGSIRARHVYHSVRGRFREVLDGARGNERSAADHHEIIRRYGHLAHEVGGDQHGAALPSQITHELSYPPHAVRIESVHRFIEEEDLRIAQQCGGDSEALAHSERESLEPLICHLRDAGELEHIVHSLVRDTVGARNHPELLARRALGMECLAV